MDNTIEGITGMSPSGKLNPSFRKEDQEMAEELKPQVIGPPAYASPDPRTNEGRLVAIEEHPLSAELAEDYGRQVAEERDTDTVSSPMEPSTGGGAQPGGELPENREEYTKANWQTLASNYGLSTSGNKDEVKARVEAYEGELDHDREMTASEWIDEVNGAASTEDLQAIRARYDMSGSEYSTVEDAFTAKQAEFDE